MTLSTVFLFFFFFEATRGDRLADQNTFGEFINNRTGNVKHITSQSSGGKKNILLSLHG